MFRKLTTAAVAFAVAVGLAACGSSDADSTASTSGATGGSGGGGGTIAVITVDPSNPYWKAEVDTAVAEALKALHRRCADVRYLGSWPTGAALGALPPKLDEADRWLTRLREGSA